jgi:hypothetical protein
MSRNLKSKKAPAIEPEWNVAPAIEPEWNEAPAIEPEWNSSVGRIIVASSGSRVRTLW